MELVLKTRNSTHLYCSAAFYSMAKYTPQKKIEKVPAHIQNLFSKGEPKSSSSYGPSKIKKIFVCGFRKTGHKHTYLRERER